MSLEETLIDVLQPWPGQAERAFNQTTSTMPWLVYYIVNVWCPVTHLTISVIFNAR